jgi:hypothetical protein
MFDIHVKKREKSPKIALTIRETKQTSGYCIEKGGFIQINMHRETYKDFEKYLNQVWLFCVSLTAILLLVLK